jgi:plasmid stability protein
MDCYLYSVKLPDGRGYLGVTKWPETRFTEHCRNRYEVGKAIRAAGRENVEFKILVRGGQDYIFALEEKAVEAFGTRWPNGLNVASGGFGGRDHLPEIREKCRRAVVGMRRSEETRAKISAARRGRSPSQETRDKLAAAGRGKQMPDAVKAKISAALIGKPRGKTKGGV